MAKKKKIVMTYDFDSPQIMASWKQLMRENAEGMSQGLAKMLEEVGIKSDPKIYMKEDTVIIKTINTDKGRVLIYSDDKMDNFMTKQYKLVPNDEKYLTIENNKAIFWIKRGGEADDMLGAFPSLEAALEGLKNVEDPRVKAARIKEQDIKQGILNEDGTPKMKLEKGVDEAVPSVKE